MTNKELIFHLVEKKERQKLAPFYIVRNHPSLSQEELEHWMHQFLNQLLKSEGRPVSNEFNQPKDPDTLVLHTKDRHYKVEQINEALKLLQYDSLRQKHRYWIIKNAHKCTPLISNKLLKTLEENPKDSTIFLLDSGQAPLSPTIKSRGVLLRLTTSLSNTPTPSHFSSFLQKHDPELAKLWDNKLPLHQLIQNIQSHQKTESFTLATFRWKHHHLTTFEQCQDFLELARSVKEHKDFYGLKQSLLAQLIPSLLSHP